MRLRPRTPNRQRFSPSFKPLVAALTLLFVGCAPAAPPSPTAPPAKPAAGGQATTSADWDRVVAAAKQEGKITVMGAGDPSTRDALTLDFQEKYGIDVEYLGDAGPGIPPRVSAERGAGQYLWDIFTGGTTTALSSLIPMGALQPMEPFLLPEVKDPKQWRGGGPEFVDSGRQVLVMTPTHRGTLYVNTTLVKPEEFKSYRDLLDPKWKGKFLMDDPRKAGSGQATFTFFYLHKDLGPDFIRALAKQEPTIYKEYQQEVDALGQGRFPVLLSTADRVAEERISQGAPIAIVDQRQIKEGTDISPANGSVALFDRAPHPNAARVYLNWLLSKEGQTRFSKAVGYVSARLDVPTDHVLAWRVPSPGAIKTYTQEAIDVKDDLQKLLKEVLGE